MSLSKRLVHKDPTRWGGPVGESIRVSFDLTGPLSRQILARIEQIAWHPT